MALAIHSVMITICTLHLFQGFRNHKESNVLEDPGTMDLTADVNFSIIKNMVNEKGQKRQV